VVAQIRNRVAADVDRLMGEALSSMLGDFDRLLARQHGRPEVQRQLDGLRRSTETLLDELEDIVHGVRTGNTDLVPELRDHLLGKARLEVSGRWPARVSPSARDHILQIVLEAVRNAQIHGRAKVTKVALRVNSRGTAIVSITDDGTGLAGLSGGFGLAGMRERCHLLGGTMSVGNRRCGGVKVIALFVKENLK
jgi:signal transduction histidine kinase